VYTGVVGRWAPDQLAWTNLFSRSAGAGIGLGA
jgi:hypothetical protein